MSRSGEDPAVDESGRINHDGGKLVWMQVADLLREQLVGMAAGQMLPSVRTLMQTYGVSDGTVKRALVALREENLIITYQGRGSFKA
jgi:DNA-binding GntR family transcriptional regulator